jgi:2-oxoglutarate dehydrogenase E1 component
MSESNGNDSIQLDSRNAAYVEGLLEEYLKDSSSVPPVWQEYFRALTATNGDMLAAPARPKFKPTSVFNPSGNTATSRETVRSEQLVQHRGDQLVVGYRVHGHLGAKLDPLGLAPRNPLPLNPGHYGLTKDDFDREIMTTFGGRDSRPMLLRDLIQRLNRTYCDHIGFEYMHIAERNIREWIQQRIETDDIDRSPPRDLNVLANICGKRPADIFREFDDP